jgi:hypothetical protein
MNDENESKLRVKDRRMFNPDGSLREPLSPEDVEAREERSAPPPRAPEPEKRAEPESRPQTQATSTPPAEPRETGQKPAPSGDPGLFADLVSSLAYQAAMLMGLVRDPLGPQMPTDMRAARQTIEMLAMLKDKTQGNLTEDEAALLEQALGDLRLQFVQMAQRSGKL